MALYAAVLAAVAGPFFVHVPALKARGIEDIAVESGVHQSSWWWQDEHSYQSFWFRNVSTEFSVEPPGYDPVSGGAAVPVVYLAENPQIAALGRKGDSIWRLSGLDSVSDWSGIFICSTYVFGRLLQLVLVLWLVVVIFARRFHDFAVAGPACTIGLKTMLMSFVVLLTFVVVAFCFLPLRGTHAHPPECHLPSVDVGRWRAYRFDPDSVLLVESGIFRRYLRSDTLAGDTRQYPPRLRELRAHSETVWCLASLADGTVRVEIHHYRPDRRNNSGAAEDSAVFVRRAETIPRWTYQVARPAVDFDLGDSVMQYREGALQCRSRADIARERRGAIEKELLLLMLKVHAKSGLPVAVFVNDEPVSPSLMLVKSNFYEGVPLWQDPLHSELDRYRIQYVSTNAAKGQGVLLSAERAE